MYCQKIVLFDITQKSPLSGALIVHRYLDIGILDGFDRNVPILLHF
jgi:hypothetical protein